MIVGIPLCYSYVEFPPPPGHAGPPAKSPLSPNSSFKGVGGYGRKTVGSKEDTPLARPQIDELPLPARPSAWQCGPAAWSVASRLSGQNDEAWFSQGGMDNRCVPK